MPVHNSDIAAILKQVADFLDIKGANPFRVRLTGMLHVQCLDGLKT